MADTRRSTRASLGLQIHAYYDMYAEQRKLSKICPRDQRMKLFQVMVGQELAIEHAYLANELKLWRLLPKHFSFECICMHDKRASSYFPSQSCSLLCLRLRSNSQQSSSTLFTRDINGLMSIGKAVEAGS